MFRRATYEAAGGYRREFRFGQDWDLWYRLSERGRFCMIGDTLYRARVGVGDISTTRRAMQDRFAQLSLRALRARASGQSDEALLREAQRESASCDLAADERDLRLAAADASYFLGECLRRNGNLPRARDYFLLAIEKRPWHAKAWLRLAQLRLASR
jgi:tetratricopeptide (TPR) repeat protein